MADNENKTPDESIKEEEQSDKTKKQENPEDIIPRAIVQRAEKIENIFNNTQPNNSNSTKNKEKVSSKITLEEKKPSYPLEIKDNGNYRFTISLNAKDPSGEDVQAGEKVELRIDGIIVPLGEPFNQVMEGGDVFIDYEIPKTATTIRIQVGKKNTRAFEKKVSEIEIKEPTDNSNKTPPPENITKPKDPESKEKQPKINFDPTGSHKEQIDNNNYEIYLQVSLKDQDKNILPNHDYEITIGAQKITGKTDANGELEITQSNVPINTRQVIITSSLNGQNFTENFPIKGEKIPDDETHSGQNYRDEQERIGHEKDSNATIITGNIDQISATQKQISGLQIIIRDSENNPILNRSCLIDIEGRLINRNTNDRGIIDIPTNNVAIKTDKIHVKPDRTNKNILINLGELSKNETPAGLNYRTENKNKNAEIKPTNAKCYREQISDTEYRIHIEGTLQSGNSSLEGKNLNILVDNSPLISTTTVRNGKFTIETIVSIGDQELEITFPRPQGNDKSEMIDISKMTPKAVSQEAKDYEENTKETADRQTAHFQTGNNASNTREQISETEQRIHIEDSLTTDGNRELGDEEIQLIIDNGTPIDLETNPDGTIVIDETIPLNARQVELVFPPSFGKGGRKRININNSLKEVTSTQGNPHREQIENRNATLNLVREGNPGTRTQTSATEQQISIQAKLTNGQSPLPRRTCEVLRDNNHLIDVQTNDQGLLILTNQTIPLNAQNIEIRFPANPNAQELIIAVNSLKDQPNIQGNQFSRDRQNQQNRVNRQISEDRQLENSRSSIGGLIQEIRRNYTLELHEITTEIHNLQEVLNNLTNTRIPERNRIPESGYGNTSTRYNLGLDYPHPTRAMLLNALRARIANRTNERNRIELVNTNINRLILPNNTFDLTRMETEIQALISSFNGFPDYTKRIEYITRANQSINPLREIADKPLTDKNSTLRNAYIEAINIMIGRLKEYQNANRLRERQANLNGLIQDGTRASNEITRRNGNRVFNKLSDQERTRLTQIQDIGRDAQIKLTQERINDELVNLDRTFASRNYTMNDLQTWIEAGLVLVGLNQNPQERHADNFLDNIRTICSPKDATDLIDKITRARVVP